MSPRRALRRAPGSRGSRANGRSRRGRGRGRGRTTRGGRVFSTSAAGTASPMNASQARPGRKKSARSGGKTTQIRHPASTRRPVDRDVVDERARAGVGEDEERSRRQIDGDLDEHRLVRAELVDDRERDSEREHLPELVAVGPDRLGDHLADRALPRRKRRREVTHRRPPAARRRPRRAPRSRRRSATPSAATRTGSTRRAARGPERPASAAARSTAKPSIASTSAQVAPPPTRALVAIGRTCA